MQAHVGNRAALTTFAQMAYKKHQNSESFVHRFYKQREVEAIKQAQENGFFFNPTEEALLLHCQTQNPDQKDLRDFRLIHLGDIHLRVLGKIGMCANLSICLLANNFLTKIDALVSCKHLFRLDVHSNELKSIPGTFFWKNLDKLQVLHLHDNPLATFEILQMLGSSPSLSILTLYDTPISLKKNYRHHVVNSIWTLKALDKFVISDEEIIEDAVFRYERFTALSSAFRIDLCPESSPDLTYAQELSVLHSLVARVDSILARNSPVHIVQRCFRGYLVRKKLRTAQKLAQGIQKEITNYVSSTPLVPRNPACTPNMGDIGDCDSWRPSSYSEPGYRQGLEPDKQMVPQEFLPFTVSLQKLQAGVLTALKSENPSGEINLDSGKLLALSSKKDRRNKSKKKQNETKSNPKRIQDVKEFFGCIVPPVSSELNETEIPQTDFRITGTRPTLLTVDATTEMLLAKKEAGEMIRALHAERIQRGLRQPPLTVKYNSLTKREKKLFDRAQGTMGLACLMAVYNAYKQREKSEMAAAKLEHNMALREERLQVKEKMRKYNDEQQKEVLRSRELEKRHLLEQLEKQELQRLHFLSRLQDQKVQRSELKRRQYADYAFMHEFNCQRSSVSNTLLRYDQQARVEKRKKGKQKEVSERKKCEQEQKEVVKKYLEHRKIRNQQEMALIKAELTEKLQADTRKRMMEAQTRVAYLKAEKALMEISNGTESSSTLVGLP